MKNIFKISGFMVLALFMTVWYSCEEEEPEDTCLQDEICEAKYVTACQDEDGNTYYQFGGKEYPDTNEGLNQLAIDLGCGTAIAGTKSADLQPVIQRLLDLKAQLKKQ